MAVLQRLEVASAPVSHGEIADKLGTQGFDRATVYRNLVDLVEAGLVTRTDLGDHVWRFEVVRGEPADHPGEHPHFLCVDCGDVSCLPGDAVTIAPLRGVPRAASKRKVEVQLKGRCDTCAR
jgi:Fur family transcriptional regulator, ferric uptake regulator